MRVKTNKIFTDLDGNQLPGPDGGIFTLRDAARTALTAAFQDEQSLSGEDKFKRYEICLKLSPTDDAELTAEDISVIKKVIGKAFTPIIVGQAWTMLEDTGSK